MRKYVFTKEGLKELEEQIRETKERLTQSIKLKAEAGSGQNGWHDEGFKLGTTEEMLWSKKLGELQDLYSNAQVIEPEEQNDFVKIGTGAIIEYEYGSTCTFILDGYVIGSLKNRVSIYSPLGRAILNAKKGDEIILQTGSTKRIIKVKEIFSPSTVGKKE